MNLKVEWGVPGYLSEEKYFLYKKMGSFAKTVEPEYLGPTRANFGE